MGKRILTYSDGETIISRCENERRMYIILDGEVEVSVNDGIKKIVLATLKKRDFFGECSLFNQTPRSADVISRGKTKLTFVNSIEELETFLEQNPGFSVQMVKTLAARLARTDQLLVNELGGQNQPALISFLW